MTKSRLAALDPHLPENLGLLAYLGREGGVAAIASPSSVPDPYQGCGSHPDIVERVWDQLGHGLPRAGRALVFGTPALVHERAGLVLAVALGTQYALRVPPSGLAQAEALGLRTSHRFGTSAETLDLAAFGSSWRLGAWRAEEPAWVCVEHARLG